MPYSEFYCQTTGSNLNAGDTTADAAIVTSTNGNWDSTTGVFICNGATDLSGVSVGMFASVYVDGASVGVFVGRITAVVDATDTITVSTTVISGTAPSTSATGRTITVGGAWKGPNAAEDFPFDLVRSSLRNSSDHPTRVNFKSGTNYDITAAVAHSLQGVTFQGYTSSPGDGGRFVIDGGTGGASYALLSITGTQNVLKDCELRNNGATGTAVGLVINIESLGERVVVHDVRGSGITGTGDFIECEAYACNTANTAGDAGFEVTSTNSQVVLRCIAHHNTGSNNQGFRHATASGLTMCIECVAHGNGLDGFAVSVSRSAHFYYKCDAYDNGGDGIRITDNSSSSTIYIQNCNLVKNAGYGINLVSFTAGDVLVKLTNNGFGSGTMANTSGQTNGLLNFDAEGSITYPANVTPWIDPGDGDFRINLAEAKGAGRGAFFQTQSGYGDPNPTLAYPDIGAAQSRSLAHARSLIVQSIGTY